MTFSCCNTFLWICLWFTHISQLHSLYRTFAVACAISPRSLVTRGCAVGCAARTRLRTPDLVYRADRSYRARCAYHTLPRICGHISSSLHTAFAFTSTLSGWLLRLCRTCALFTLRCVCRVCTHTTLHAGPRLRYARVALQFAGLTLCSLLVLYRIRHHTFPHCVYADLLSISLFPLLSVTAFGCAFGLRVWLRSRLFTFAHLVGYLWLRVAAFCARFYTHAVHLLSISRSRYARVWICAAFARIISLFAFAAFYLCSISLLGFTHVWILCTRYAFCAHAHLCRISGCAFCPSSTFCTLCYLYSSHTFTHFQLYIPPRCSWIRWLRAFTVIAPYLCHLDRSRLLDYLVPLDLYCSGFILHLLPVTDSFTSFARLHCCCYTLDLCSRLTATHVHVCGCSFTFWITLYVLVCADFVHFAHLPCVHTLSLLLSISPLCTLYVLAVVYAHALRARVLPTFTLRWTACWLRIWVFSLSYLVRHGFYATRTRVACGLHVLPLHVCSFAVPFALRTHFRIFLVLRTLQISGFAVTGFARLRLRTRTRARLRAYAHTFVLASLVYARCCVCCRLRCCLLPDLSFTRTVSHVHVLFLWMDRAVVADCALWSLSLHLSALPLPVYAHTHAGCCHTPVTRCHVGITYIPVDYCARSHAAHTATAFPRFDSPFVTVGFVLAFDCRLPRFTYGCYVTRTRFADLVAVACICTPAVTRYAPLRVCADLTFARLSHRFTCCV